MATKRQCEECNYYDSRKDYCARFFSQPAYDGSVCDPNAKQSAPAQTATTFVFDNQPTEEQLTAARRPLRIIYVFYIIMLFAIPLMIIGIFLLMGCSWQEMVEMMKVPKFAGKMAVLLVYIPILLKMIKQTKEKMNCSTFRKVTVSMPNRTFLYEDAAGKELFGPAEIDKWLYGGKAEHICDAFLLKDGKIISLAGYYQTDMHSFLLENKDALGLPELQRMNNEHLRMVNAFEEARMRPAQQETLQMQAKA